ncbi:MAG: hypothetical protein K2J37_07795 [Ruminococcus sp.]|nr:hypothetical protein [Ruminococcus sp.]
MTQYDYDTLKDDDILKNAVLMNKCRRIYNTVSILYAGVIVTYSLICLISGFMIVSAAMICDSVFIKPLVIACGFMSIYKKENKFAVYVICLQIISVFIFPNGDTFLDIMMGSRATGIGSNGFIVILIVVLSGFTIYANKKYHWLEQQYGFPHFNERQMRYEEELIENSIKDKYQRNYESIVKNNFHDMQELDLSSGKNAVIPESTSESGVMDEI